MASSTAAAGRRRHHRRTKVVVIMGATGCGKSRLSIDLALALSLAPGFPSAEVINFDKTQVYRGLDITTNKITTAERRGVPHHLLGSFDPGNGEMTPSQFRHLGHDAISRVASHGKVPILVGGSNSFIHALLVKRFDQAADVFGGLSSPARTELKYDCCFLWVDVSLAVLEQNLPKRVDKMLDMGAFEELAGYYDPGRTGTGGRAALRKAIGMREFDRYFEKYPPPRRVAPGDGWRQEDARKRVADPVREVAYQEAVRAIRNNARQLAERQRKKIQLLLKGCGWNLMRLDATEAVRLAMAAEEEGGGGGRDVWKRQVVGPSVETVMRFWRET
ncbi:hypothetical protein BT93_L1059 [Corymbia citriodora subsp. variegata]|uniref:Uncharacterized protein n=1 Tax=Corymbia citriodora subsp. variegata TaxID=360336 RepID=A0A8T0CPW3_CORYI|nr:hypothetical protein BT93_L1059 [Corymbia citriodora subsp. variegata]